jgi:hypothetical protein
MNMHEATTPLPTLPRMHAGEGREEAFAAAAGLILRVGGQVIR